MKHHFVSVIGVEYDLDLAPFWIKYYKERAFDTYTVFLHREKGQIPQIVQDMYLKEGFTVRCINGPYNGGIAGAFHMEIFIRALPPEDFVTVADADEFQADENGAPIEYKKLCGEYDVLHGLFEERYGDRLDKCDKDPFVQYPHREPFTGHYFKKFCPPYLDHIDWPCVYRCKIIASRASEAYRFYGMHSLSNVSSNSKILFGLKVVHFAWREGAAQKAMKKSWYKKVCTLDPVTNELVPVVNGELVEQPF